MATGKVSCRPSNNNRLTCNEWTDKNTPKSYDLLNYLHHQERENLKNMKVLLGISGKRFCVIRDHIARSCLEIINLQYQNLTFQGITNIHNNKSSNLHFGIFSSRCWLKMNTKCSTKGFCNKSRHLDRSFGWR